MRGEEPSLNSMALRWWNKSGVSYAERTLKAFYDAEEDDSHANHAGAKLQEI